jgi:hypothetical protein
MRRNASMFTALLLALLSGLCAWLWWPSTAHSIAPIDGPRVQRAALEPPIDAKLESESVIDAKEQREAAPLAPASSVQAAAGESVCTILGEVTDAVNKRVVPNAAIRFTRGAAAAIVPSDLRGDAQAHERRTDSNGGYAELELKPGPWDVSIEAEGYRTWSNEVFIPDLPRYTLGFELQRTNLVRVRVHVEESDDSFWHSKPVAFARRELHAMLGLAATQEPPPPSLAPGHNDLRWSASGAVQSRGDFGVNESLITGNELDRWFEFPLPPPMYLSVCLAELVLQTKRVDRDDTLVTFDIPLALLQSHLHHVRVRVLDAENDQPLTSAKVALVGIRSFTVDGASPDADGNVFFENRWPGRWSFFVHAPEYESIQEAATIASSGDTDLGTYRLSRGVSIEGTLQDDQDRTVDVPLELVPAEGPDRSKERPGIVTWSGKDRGGRFLMSPVPRRKQVVRPSQADGFARDGVHWRFKPVLVDTTAGSARDVSIHCVRGTYVELRMTSGSHQELRIVDEKGLPVMESELGDFVGIECYLAPGEYEARLLDDSRIKSTTRFVVGDQNASVDLDAR